MARYGSILTLKQSFEKLGHMVRRPPAVFPATIFPPVPSPFAERFRDLYNRCSRLMPQVANLQQRWKVSSKPSLGLVPTKPRPTSLVVPHDSPLVLISIRMDASRSICAKHGKTHDYFSTGGERRTCKGTYIRDLIRRGDYFRSLHVTSKELKKK